MTALSPPTVRALVLDGQDGHALAAVRSLGRRGVVVTVASHEPRAMSFASRYCAGRVACPSPVLERAAYTRWLFETLRLGRYDATLCFQAATAEILSAHREQVQKWTGHPTPPREIFLAADRKDRVTRLASQLGIATPATHELERLEDVEALASTLTFPVVVKGVQSCGSPRIELVREPAALGPTARRVAALRRDASLPLPIVQEYIEGSDYGFTGLMRRGEPIAVFLHRRLGEPDLARGARLAHGVAGAMSVDEPDLRAAGTTILQALCWDGIATVEFRRSDRDGRFYLIEVKPRFVGSLDLAIAAGVDLPWLFLQLAAGRPVIGPNRYRVGLRYRWLLSKNVAALFASPWESALAALSALRPGTRCDLAWSDPRPHWSQLRHAAWWAHESLRAPRRSAEPGAEAPALRPPTPRADALPQERSPAEAPVA